MHNLIFCLCDIIWYNYTMNNAISGDYIAGFVDGEGCFSLSMRKDVRHERKTKPVYYSWKAMFAIVLREDDQDLLQKIQDFLNCGSITFTKNGQQVRYQVSNLNELNEVVIPFFNKYRMHGKKKEDFRLWSDAIKILVRYKKIRGRVNVKIGNRGFTKTEWNKKDITMLKNIHRDMIVYKSKRSSAKWLGGTIGREI